MIHIKIQYFMFKIIIQYYLQGFTRIFFTPDKAAQIITKCEERLIKVGIRSAPFSVDEICGGVLKELLIPSDYSAPMDVSTVL